MYGIHFIGRIEMAFGIMKSILLTSAKKLKENFTSKAHPKLTIKVGILRRRGVFFLD